jgi:protein TonB
MIRLLDGRVAGITASQPARVLKIHRQVKICHTLARVSREAVAAAKVAPVAIFSRASCDVRRRVAMNRIRLPLALSVAGHAVVLALLILFAVSTRPSPQPAMPGGFEVVLGQVLPEAKTPPAAQALPSQAAVVRTVEATEPAPTPEPEVPILPPDQTAAVPVPPPPRKPVVREPPKHVMRRPERPRSLVAEPTPPPARFAELPPAGSAGAQYPAAQPAAAAVGPSHVPEPDAAASYRAMISAWLESHKRYPESARERGEEGNAALRFRIDRSGRVLDYSYRSTGYSDLDAGLDEMLRGAQLPPFPPGITASRIEVSLTMQFNLTR